MMGPNDVLIVGVEDDPSGMLRIYMNSPEPRCYVLIENEEDKERARREWEHSYQGHLFMKQPPRDAIYKEGEDA